MSIIFKENPGLFAFFFGVLFIILIVILAIALPEPTEFQYLVFRIVLALAGAGFAVSLSGSLEVFLPLFKQGSIKAAAGFAAFVILFFFNPASIVVDQDKLRVDQLRGQMGDKGDVQQAFAEWRESSSSPEFLKIASEIGQLRVQKRYTEMPEKLTKMRAFVRDFSVRSKSVATMLSYFSDVAQCVDEENCSRDYACEVFFEDIEAIRWTFCEQITDNERIFNDNSWSRLDVFSRETCRKSFLLHYVNLSFEPAADICIPKQCWARHIEPPYPCFVQSVKEGMRAF